MARVGRPGGLSAAGKKELWERWRAGESISDIARALQKAPGSIHGMIEATSGFSPPEQRGRGCALTRAEREEISRGLAAGESLRGIAARLSRPASTVCREVNRNGGRRNYRAQKVEERASKRARRPKRCLLAINDRLRELVAAKLEADWSPQQISGWLKREYPSDEAMRVTRDHLPHPVRAGQRRSQEGTASPSAFQADDAQIPTRFDEGTTARADKGGRLHP